MTEKTGMMVNFPTPDDQEINAISGITQVLNHFFPLGAGVFEDQASENARKRIIMYVLKRETQK